jgi:hypothetical protein
MVVYLLFCLFIALIASVTSAEDAVTLIESQIKSCLGDHCGSFAADGSGLARIGILGPPQSGAEVIWSILQYARTTGGIGTPKSSFKKAKDSSTSSNAAIVEDQPNIVLGDITLVLSTHVPPYGYGKNHGWTKIVRVYRNILDHTVDLLKGMNTGMKTTEANPPSTPTVDSASAAAVAHAQARLLVRWHCRLSHVAAHTKMFSSE